ncbi:hypothetical protein DDN26_14875 [Vibrio cholerae]|uniref:hypothetical protein n=1 Tax=Vibrio fluvialis TaxID=676 RepID=UPI00257466A5|nr:hypothetical protein [Vibrio fluvialis]EGR4421543.1 hypothetical protein [Vibrio cholerae]
MPDYLIEKLLVAKDYLRDVVGYQRIDGVMQPRFDTVDSGDKVHALAVVKAYYQGGDISRLPLNY